MSTPRKWYSDPLLVRALPVRYRAYALYSRLIGRNGSPKIRGGSFLLRALRRFSRLSHLSTVVPIHGVDGLVVLADMGDERVLDVVREIRGEHPEYTVMRSLLNEGDTFIDIGANAGTYALIASRLVGRSGKVIAIEPQPSLAQYISWSSELSKAEIDVREVACGISAGSAELMIPVNDTGRAGMHAEFSGKYAHARLSVPVSSLDSLLESVKWAGKMLIKIDVEGNELNILNGATATIARYSPAIIVELNQWSAKAARTSVRAIVERLQSMGYTSFIDTADFPTEIAATAILHDRQINLLAIK